MQLQSFIVLLSLVSSPILSLSTTQQSGAGPHVGAVLGRLPSLAVTVPAISIANASSSIKSRNFGLARIVGQGSVQKRTSIADEAAGIQSAVYAIIVSISSGLSSANSLISGSTNVSFARLVFFFFFCVEGGERFFFLGVFDLLGLCNYSQNYLSFLIQSKHTINKLNSFSTSDRFLR